MDREKIGSGTSNFYSDFHPELGWVMIGINDNFFNDHEIQRRLAVFNFKDYSGTPLRRTPLGKTFVLYKEVSFKIIF